MHNQVQAIWADTQSVVIFISILAVTILVGTLAGRYLKRILIKRTQNLAVDSTSFLFLKHFIVTTIYLFGFGWAFLTLPISKTIAHSLFAGAGVSTLILGFASQQLLSNMMSGIFLIIRRPFKINDIIEIQGNRGKVIELDLHATTIEDENENQIIIPNSLLMSGIIKNLKKT
jgi:small conductance mechanosensitive channel